MKRGDVAALVRPFDGDVFCHAPADRPFDVDALAREDDGEDRWSSPGTSTIYLAGNALVATAEYARHGPTDGSGDARRLVRLHLGPVSLLDVRDAAVQSALGGVDHPIAWLDPSRARDAAREIREARICEGLLVPSMAFVDRDDVFNIVLFCEAIDRPLGELLTGPEEIGRIEVRTSAADRGISGSAAARG